MNTMLNSQHTRHLLLLIAATMLLAATQSACRGSTRKAPPVHVNWNMDNQKYLSAQEPFSFFEDGRAMRPWVEGTVSEAAPEYSEVELSGKVGDTYATETPMPLDRELLERGQERYEIFCTPCHGSTGDGNGIVRQRARTWNIPTFHDEMRRGRTVGQVYEIITDGFSTMPSYRSQIPLSDRWAIAAYVKALQLTQGASRDAVPADVLQSNGW